MNYEAFTGPGTLLLAIAAILTIIFDQIGRRRKAHNIRTQIRLYLNQLISLLKKEIKYLEGLDPPVPKNDNDLPKTRRKLPSLEKYVLPINALFTQGQMLRPIENNKLLSILLLLQEYDENINKLHPYNQLIKLNYLCKLLTEYFHISI